ncbi:YopX family protein [Latilactobacillus sakei]|uniref:YopX family protein n=1 Tax=Latilactobacillus sakei TaxID=1599 RepID=UPI0039AF3283
MREIKFRAYIRDEGRLLNVNLIDFDDEYVRVWDEYDENEEEWFFKDINLMQYTGLKDVNGVEIYEGDVVSFGSVWDNGDNEDLDEEIHIGVVEYDPHYAVYNVNCEESGERRFLLMDVVNYDGFGVIGNIYESPELLEVRDEQ